MAVGIKQMGLVRKAQQKNDAQIEQLMKAQERTDLQIEQLVKAQQKSDAKFDRLIDVLAGRGKTVTGKRDRRQSSQVSSRP